MKRITIRMKIEFTSCYSAASLTEQNPDTCCRSPGGKLFGEWQVGPETEDKARYVQSYLIGWDNEAERLQAEDVEATGEPTLKRWFVIWLQSLCGPGSSGSRHWKLLFTAVITIIHLACRISMTFLIKRYVWCVWSRGDSRRGHQLFECHTPKWSQRVAWF